jgi:hypothetical protein
MGIPPISRVVLRSAATSATGTLLLLQEVSILLGNMLRPTYHCIYFIFDGTLGSNDRVSGANEADLTFNFTWA